VLGFALPLVLAAVLVLAWRMPHARGAGGSEMLYFLAAAVVGYPLVGVLSGFLGVKLGLPWFTVPVVAVFGYVLATGMHLAPLVGVTFAFWGAVVTVCAIIYALRTYNG
ncbi:MAG: hypothetical protein IJF36_02625, partial [Oscillibacter sp.]|nr:hypothetical protein [Oscillibacter sp.]